MAKGQVTRRQKDISRVLREKKQIRPDRVKKITKKEGAAYSCGRVFSCRVSMGYANQRRKAI